MTTGLRIEARGAVRAGARHLVLPGSGRTHGARLAPVRRLRRGHLSRCSSNAFPLLTASMLAVGAIVLTGTIKPEQAYSGFANSSVLLVVIAFIVAQAVVKSGLGRRVSLFMVSRFGGSSLGLAYSIVLTDAAIAPAFPSNTARGGVLFPIVLAVAKGAGSEPDSESRYLGGYLMFCSMAGLAVSSALWMTATSANPVALQIVRAGRARIDFGKWLLASAVPSLIAIVLLPLIVAKLFPPRVGKTPEAPAAARRELAGMGGMSRDEWITAGTFVLMVAGWIFGNGLHLNTTSVAFMGFGVLLFLNVITLDDITKQGDTLVDLPLARGALCHERAVERARLHRATSASASPRAWAAWPGRPCT